MKQEFGVWARLAALLCVAALWGAQAGAQAPPPAPPIPTNADGSVNVYAVCMPCQSLAEDYGFTLFSLETARGNFERAREKFEGLNAKEVTRSQRDHLKRAAEEVELYEQSAARKLASLQDCIRTKCSVAANPPAEPPRVQVEGAGFGLLFADLLRGNASFGQEGDTVIGGSSGDGSFVPAGSGVEVEYVIIFNGNNPLSPTDPLGDAGVPPTIQPPPPPPPPGQIGSVQFSSSAYSAAEGTGSVQIIITRVGGASGQISVQLNTGASSASAGSDYTAASGTATWPNGDSTPKVFNIPIIDDTLVEGPETFFVSLGSPGGGATLGEPSTATVTIADNDVATGPCGATGNAWAGNAGNYSCSGTCDGLPASQTLAVNGDLVTISPHHAGGAATFQGCTNSLTSQAGNLTYFGQANHRNTITRSSNNAFSTNVVSSGGGTCFFSCSR